MKKPILPDSLAIFLLVFPFLKPHSLEYLLPIADNAFDAGRLACALVILWLCIRGPYRMSGFARAFLALQLWIAAVTALRNPARFPASLINGAALGALTLLVDYWAQKNPRQLLRSLLANFEWLLYLNLLSVLLYPWGMYSADNVHRYYFLGLSNSFMIYVLPACMVALMNLFSGMNRVRSLTVMAAGIAGILIRRPATGLVSVGVLLLVLLFAVSGKDRPRLLPGIWLVSLAVDLGITVFQVTDRVEPLKQFIVQVLHRQPNYTGRNEIWSKAMEIIAREPWIGQGFETKVPVAPDDLFSHAHNAYLQYWYIAGILGLLLFLLLLVLVIRAVCLAPAGRYKYAAIAPLAGLFFAFIPEACNYPALMMLLPLAANTAAFAGLHRARKAKALPPPESAKQESP